MRQRPDAAEFDRLADKILAEAPLPEDRGSRTYDQRLALKARSVAEFDRGRGESDLEEERALFADLHGDHEGASMEALNRRLAEEIRAGKWDRSPAALKALLLQQVRARLERSNPKYLMARLER